MVCCEVHVDLELGLPEVQLQQPAHGLGLRLPVVQELERHLPQAELEI
eukprot:CAMPEP_0176167530 /NCGR_PEP_ID=MMETSP0120_2-20121206/85717_1 /TAXON_ID=160619 /ORGANISM="Kryptoperidinium foliaceum, Strain CCMP 1326" /LENGTH=47 /DNA_ID= /DNA_START= /DNA_END= /DNA_ORIENTATION=